MFPTKNTTGFWPAGIASYAFGSVGMYGNLRNQMLEVEKSFSQWVCRKWKRNVFMYTYIYMYIYGNKMYQIWFKSCFKLLVLETGGISPKRFYLSFNHDILKHMYLYIYQKCKRYLPGSAMDGRWWSWLFQNGHVWRISMCKTCIFGVGPDWEGTACSLKLLRT